MKYSFMTFSTPELDLAQTLSLAKRLGYDGIEPRLDSGHAHGVEVAAGSTERDAIRRAFGDSGVAAACLATSCKYADPDNGAEMIAATHERIDLAGDVGCPRLRVFGGKFPDAVGRQAAAAAIVECLSAIADHAAERGVKLCLETHDAWCDPKHVAAVLRGVDHPAVGANWDVMHPVSKGGATIDESFEALEPWIAHLHVHDGVKEAGKMELVPIGTGQVDHKRVIELLKGTSFDGYLSGEWIEWEPHETHLPRELAAMKAFEGELA